jgi:hypothetical protein
MPFFWRVLVFLSLFQVGAFELLAKQKKEEPIPVPPSPVSERIQGYVKEPLKITLRATGRIEEPMDFMIRKPPQKGSLGEIRRTGPKSACVVYTSSVSDESGQDYFTYAVRSVDSPVSSPARIEIDLSSRPAVLDYPHSLDFGVVPIGDSVSMEVSIKNTGGSRAVLAPAINTPWRIENASSDVIESCGQAVLTLIFNPQTLGNFDEQLSLTPSADDFIRLRGGSNKPFDWPSQGLIITSETRNRADLSIPFKNLTENSRDVEFQWPSGIFAPNRFKIPAGSTIMVPVALETTAPPVFSYVGEVDFRSGKFAGSFPITIHPAQAKLVLEPSEILKLSETSVNDTAFGTLFVTNAGGLPSQLKTENPHRLSIRPEPSGVLVNPGETKKFEIFEKSLKSGNYRLDFKIGFAEGAMNALKIHHDVRSSQPVEKFMGLPVSQNSSTPSMSPAAEIPPVEELLLNESSPHSVKLQWKLPSPEAKNFFIERQEIIAGVDGQPQVAWKRWEGVHVEMQGDSAFAHFRKLTPNSFWKIRIIGVDSNGLSGQLPKKNFRISTTPVNLWKIPFWIWMPIVLSIFVVIPIFLQKRTDKILFKTIL